MLMLKQKCLSSHCAKYGNKQRSNLNEKFMSRGMVMDTVVAKVTLS